MGGKSTKLLSEAQERGTTTLNLSSNNLLVLTPEIEILKETLLKLSLAQNRISFLPFEVSKLLKLRYINLSKNKFKIFPTVLCELPVLEVVDLSHNKIKRLPSNFGKSIQILSLVNNRITVLTQSIAEATNLKILDVEDNPIVFPPKSVWKKKKGVTDEEWLNELREWIVLNESTMVVRSTRNVLKDDLEDDDLYNPAEKKGIAIQKLIHDQGEVVQQMKKKHEEELKRLEQEHANQIRRHTTNSGYVETPALSILRMKGFQKGKEDELRPLSIKPIPDDCEQLCNQYFRNYHLDNLSGREKTILQACRSILLADLQIWKTIKQGLHSSSNRNLSKILWRVQNENADRITAFIFKLEECQPKKSKNNALTLKELESSGLSMTQSLRRLIKSFIPLLGVVTKTTDVRIIKNMLLTWSNSIGDIYEAIELLTNRFPDLQDESSGMRPRAGSNEFFFRGAINAHDAVFDLISLLAESNIEARNLGEEKNDTRFLNILSGLEKLIERAEEVMNDLAFVIESWDEGTTDLEQVYRVAEEFVHGVSRMTVVAKIIHMEFNYSNDVVELLEEVSQTVKFLATYIRKVSDESEPQRPSLDINFQEDIPPSKNSPKGIHARLQSGHGKSSSNIVYQSSNSSPNL